MRSPFLCICLFVYTGLSSVFAQTTPESDADLRRQVGALREAVIQQTRQIDALTAEIERLGVALNQRRPPKAPTVGTTQIPTPAPIASAVGTTPAASATPVATPEPTPIPNTLAHTVVKGDNLSNISKKYGTTIEVVQKLNKITDARKIQVGQVLAIPLPSPTASPAASPAVSATPAASPAASASPAATAKP